MCRIAIIGVGNETRGDDGVGLVVARRLQRTLPAGVSVMEARNGGLDLLDLWRDMAVTILIDASACGAKPGTIHRLEPLRQPLPAGWFPPSTHAFGVVEAIALGRALQQLPSHLVVYGIEAKQFDSGRALSPEVCAAVPDVMRQVRQEIITFEARATGEHRHA